MNGDAPGLRLGLTAITHPGRVRKENEDSLGFSRCLIVGSGAEPVDVEIPVHEPLTLLVADGLGGHQGGAEASRIAVETILASAGAAVDAVEAASRAIRDRALTDLTLAGMGTTVVGLTVHPNGSASVFNVGDSRAYRLVDGYPGQLSDDDRPPELGGLTSSVVTQYLGAPVDKPLDLHLFEFEAVSSERLLLCSDGLHDAVSSAQIGRSLALPRRQAADDLLKSALEAGGPDNISLIVVDIPDGLGDESDGGSK